MRMFAPVYFICLLTGVSAIAPRFAAAQTAAAPVAARQALTLEISNKDGLVTVREEEGAYRFAQVLPNAPVLINFRFDHLTKKINLVISNTNKKPLYTTTLGDGGHGGMGLATGMTVRRGYTGVTISFTPSDAPPNDQESKDAEGNFVLGAENFLTSGAVVSEGEAVMRAELRDGEPVMLMHKDDKWVEMKISKTDDTVSGTIDGVEEFRVKGEGGKVVVTGNGEKPVAIAYDEKTKTSAVSLNGKKVAEVGSGKKTLAKDGDSIQIISLDNKQGKVKMLIERIDGKFFHVLQFGNRRVIFPVETLKPVFKDNGDIRIVPSGQ